MVYVVVDKTTYSDTGSQTGRIHKSGWGREGGKSSICYFLDGNWAKVEYLALYIPPYLLYV